MKIRDFISIVDNAQQISELDLKGRSGNRAINKAVAARAKERATSAAPPAQGNMDIKYQGKPISNAPANLAPKAAATPNSNVIRYPTMNISPGSRNAAGQAGSTTAAGQAGVAPSAAPAGGGADQAGGGNTTAAGAAPAGGGADQAGGGNTTAAGAAPAEPGKLAKAWDITKKGASALGQAAKTYGPGLARGAANLATGTVQAAGNIAAQTAGGIAQTVGAIPGGAVAGYKTARAGKQFKMRPDAADEPAAASTPSAGSAPSAAAGSAPSAAGGGGGYDEVADLRQLVNRLDARVTALSARIPAQTAPAQAVGEHRRPRRLRVVR